VALVRDRNSAATRVTVLSHIHQRMIRTAALESKRRP